VNGPKFLRAIFIIGKEIMGSRPSMEIIFSNYNFWLDFSSIPFSSHTPITSDLIAVIYCFGTCIIGSTFWKGKILSNIFLKWDRGHIIKSPREVRSKVLPACSINASLILGWQLTCIDRQNSLIESRSYFFPSTSQRITPFSLAKTTEADW